MGFIRSLVYNAGNLPKPLRAGDGLLANVRVSVVTADANQTLTIPQIAGGAINYTGFSVGRNLTTPTGAQLAAAFPDMDIGDSYSFIVSIQDAVAGTWVAGDANVTLAGRATVPASSWSWVVIEKTGANTFLWTPL